MSNKKHNLTKAQQPAPTVQQPAPTPRPLPAAAGDLPQPLQFDPWLLWVTFRRCWPWAVPAGTLLAGCVAFYILYTFIPSYKATHILTANNEYLVFKGVNPTYDNLAASERLLFYSPVVLDPVLADPSLRDAPSLSDPEKAEQNLEKNLGLSSIGRIGSRLAVTYVDTDPTAAAMVCNAVVESYLRQRDALDNARVSDLQRWLEPEIQRWEQQVEERQQVVQKLTQATLGYAQGNRVSKMEDNVAFGLASTLRSQISDLHVQLSLLDARIAEDDNLAPLDHSNIVVNPSLPTEADIAEVVNASGDVREAASMVSRYERMMLELEDGDLVRLRQERYQELKDKRDSWQAKLEEAKTAASERAMPLLQERAEENAVAERTRIIAEREANRRQDIDSRKRERQGLLTQLEVLQQEYNEERSRLEQYGGATAELQFAQAELAVAYDVLSKLRNRSAAIRTERRQDGSVKTYSEAKAPKVPVEAIPTKKLITASTAVFFIPFLFGLLWEFKVQRVTDSATVEKKGTLAPVVGEVAKLPSGLHQGRSRRVFEESIDTLRSNLFMSRDTKHTRTVAVVSAISAEGKSSVSSQLAISMAKATGETVLLVDCDLRCPDQHDIFGLEMGPGVCGVLSGEAKFDEAVNKSLGDLVHVLPAGRLNCSPHRLVNESSMREFTNEALERYKYIVFDTAPVLSAGETLAVAANADSTLVCVMRDVSRMENVTRTTRRLEASGAEVAGTVFNGVSARQYAYRYGDYHYSVPAELNG